MMFSLKNFMFKNKNDNHDYYVVIFKPTNTTKIRGYTVYMPGINGVDFNDTRAAVCRDVCGCLYYKDYLSLSRNQIAIEHGLPFFIGSENTANMLEDNQILLKIKLKPEEYFKPFKIKEDCRFTEFFI